MKPVTAIIADDEKNLRLSLSIFLVQMWPELEIIGQAQDGIEALKMIEEKQPDIAFLDIKMPGLSGIDVAKKKSTPCKVVFITAFDQFAVQAFETQAVDYILKPIGKDRLEKTILRLKNQSASNHPSPRADEDLKKIIQVLETRHAPDYLKLIKVKTGNEIRFIPASKVVYFKAQDKYTVVATETNEFLINMPIKTLECQLDPNQFWRVHRSGIVNVDKINTIRRSFSNQMIIGFEQIEETMKVSRSYEHLFKQM